MFHFDKLIIYRKNKRVQYCSIHQFHVLPVIDCNLHVHITINGRQHVLTGKVPFLGLKSQTSVPQCPELSSAGNG